MHIEKVVQIKTLYLFILFTLLFVISAFSQEDTTSSLSVLYNQSIQTAKHKADSIRWANPKFGCGLYGGIGTGGNKNTSGIAYGAGASFHYKFHTVNMYATLSTKSEEISSGFDRTYTLYGSNYGFMYGAGAYDKNFSVSGGAGIGYSRINMVLQEGNRNVSVNGWAPGYVSVYYSKVGLCVGGQATVHGRFIGFTTQFYLNITSAITSYVFLLGLAIVPQ
jgi:hypothetical protein